MSVCLARLALLTGYDKLPSVLTPSLGYLWLINWTGKGPCRPSRGLQCSSRGPSSKKRTKEARGRGRTNVSAPGLETLSTKLSKICLRTTTNLWKLRWTRLGWWAVYFTPSLWCCGTFWRSLCLELRARWPHCFSPSWEVVAAQWSWAPSRISHGPAVGLWGSHAVSELQIPPLWSEGVRSDDLLSLFQL